MAPAAGAGGTSAQTTGGRAGAMLGGSAGRGGATSSGGSSTATGGTGGSGPAESAGEGGEGGEESTGEGGSLSPGKGGTGAVPSADGYPVVPPPVCDTPTDYPCDERRVECAAPDEVLTFDAARDASCPVCAPPPAGSRSCEKSRREYREFLAAVISASCANYCEEDADCAAWELTNSCGSVALSLEGGIDEEPIGLAEEFAASRCTECGQVAQTMTLRRAGSSRLEADPSSAGLLDDYGPRCINNQCVLAPL